jgi:hypothetical protein
MKKSSQLPRQSKRIKVQLYLAWSVGLRGRVKDPLARQRN